MKRESFIAVDPDGRKYRVYWHTHRERWYVQWKDNQGWQRKSLDARSKPEAEHAVRRTWKPTEQMPDSSTIQQTALNWSEFADRYLDYKRQQGKAPRSVERFSAALEAFGRYLKTQDIMTVERITLTMLEGYKSYRMKNEE